MSVDLHEPRGTGREAIRCRPARSIAGVDLRRPGGKAVRNGYAGVAGAKASTRNRGGSNSTTRVRTGGLLREVARNTAQSDPVSVHMLDNLQHCQGNVSKVIGTISEGNAGLDTRHDALSRRVDDVARKLAG